MIYICEYRFIGEIGDALHDFGSEWEDYTTGTDRYHPIGEQLYAQMMGWA